MSISVFFSMFSKQKCKLSEKYTFFLLLDINLSNQNTSGSTCRFICHNCLLERCYTIFREDCLFSGFVTVVSSKSCSSGTFRAFLVCLVVHHKLLEVSFMICLPKFRWLASWPACRASARYTWQIECHSKWHCIGQVWWKMHLCLMNSHNKAVLVLQALLCDHAGTCFSFDKSYYVVLCIKWQFFVSLWP